MAGIIRITEDLVENQDTGQLFHRTVELPSRAKPLLADNNRIDYKIMPQYDIEDFLQSATGNIIPMTSTVASGGSLATEIPENQANWGGGANYSRFGQASVRISNGANSRSALYTSPNFRLYPSANFQFMQELSFVSSSIDFINDPVLAFWGFSDSFVGNPPANGIYFRCPRTSETQFLKYVIRIANVESIFNTTMPYDSTNRRFLRTSIQWNGTDMIFKSTNNVSLYEYTIPNFLSTYPSLGTLNMSYGTYMARNGSGAVALSRNINIDRVERRINPTYQNILI